MLSFTHTANASAATGSDSGSPIIEEAPGSCQYFKYWLSKPAQSRSVHNEQVMLGLEGIFVFSTARVPVNQYQQWLFLPSLLLSQKLSLQCSCGAFPLFQDTYGFASVRCWFFIWFNHFCWFFSLLLCCSMSENCEEQSEKVWEALMHQMKSSCSLPAFPSRILISPYWSCVLLLEFLTETIDEVCKSLRIRHHLHSPIPSLFLLFTITFST